MPKCECGEELEFDYDTDVWNDGDVVTTPSYGHCPKCGKKYRWLDHFVISYWNELEEI